GIAEISSDVRAWGSRISLPGEVDPRRTSVVLSPLAEDGSAPRWAFHSTASARVPVEVSARSRPGPALESLLDAPERFSSEDRVGDDATSRPGAAFDGDPATAWRVPAGRESATVDVELPSATSIGRISTGGTGLAGIRATIGGRVTTLPRTGGAVEGEDDRISLTFVRTAGEGEWTVPEVELDAIAAPEDVRVPCTAVTVGASTVRVGGEVDRERLVNGDPLILEPCGTAEAVVAPGTVDVRTDLPAALQVERVVLGSTEFGPGAGRSVLAREEAPGRIVASVSGGGDAVLALAQGANEGWRATTSSGRELERLTIDGWRQGFRLPASLSGEVVIDFAPSAAHRWGLAAGPVALLLLLGTLVATRRTRLPWDRWPARATTVDLRIGWLVSGVLGFLCGGLAGLVLAGLAWVIPRRRVVSVAIVSMALGAMAMAALGVVDRTSAGTVLGQLAGLFTLSLLARSLFDGGPRPGSDAPPATTTATPTPR
ncbi:MAG: hypothetical protein ABWX60_12265, partial [Aeromicrobium sp.]